MSANPDNKNRLSNTDPTLFASLRSDESFEGDDAPNIIMPDKSKNTDMPGHPSGAKRAKAIIVGVCAVAVLAACGIAYASGLVGSRTPQTVEPMVVSSTEQQSIEEPIPAGRQGAISLSLKAEGLDDEGSHIPLQVVGTQENKTLYKQVIFVTAGNTTLRLPAGSYTITVVGSPISAEGVIYEIPEAKITVEISDNGEATCDPQDASFSLSPIEANTVTDDQIDAAQAWAAKDSALATKADELAKRARQRKENSGINNHNANSTFDTYVTVSNDTVSSYDNVQYTVEQQPIQTNDSAAEQTTQESTTSESNGTSGESTANQTSSAEGSGQVDNSASADSAGSADASYAESSSSGLSTTDTPAL